MRRLLLLLVLAAPLTAQQSGRTTDLQFRTIDLVFNATDTGGRVQDLQVNETPTEVRIDLAADVLFDFDKSDILPKAAETLGKAAAIVKERAKGRVRIDGYTDGKGSEAYNLALSERRANAVRDWLRERGGLSNVTFETKGLGAANAVAPNQNPDGSDNPEGRQKNRRVEIIITK